MNTLHPKVGAAGTSGAAVTLLVGLAHAFGIELPAEVAAGLVALGAFAAGWLKRG